MRRTAYWAHLIQLGFVVIVGLVRALVMNPSVLLMDEPFAALDAQTREVLQEELLALMQRPDERKTMVFITHSIDEAILLGDRIAVMTARPGRIKEILDMPFGWPRDVDAMRSMMRPGRVPMTSTTSARYTASIRLWVTNRMVGRLSCQMRSNSLHIRVRVCSSSAANGSSISSRRGWRASPRAMATRCFMPPESWCG